MPVAGTEPVAGHSDAGRVWSPSGQGEQCGHARFESREHGGVGHESVGGADREHVRPAPAGEHEPHGDADRRPPRAEGHDHDVGLGAARVPKGVDELHPGRDVSQRAERR